jgi:hypothetical protein
MDLEGLKFSKLENIITFAIGIILGIGTFIAVILLK